MRHVGGSTVCSRVTSPCPVLANRSRVDKMRPVSSRSSRRTSRCAACVHRIAHGAAATYGNPSSRRRSSCDTTRPAAESARATPRASASWGVTGSPSIGASASAASTGSTRRGGALRRRPPFGAGFRSVSGAVRGLMVHSMHHQPSRSKGSVSAPTPEGPTPQEALHTGRAFRGAKRSAFLPLWTCRALAAWAIFLMSSSEVCDSASRMAWLSSTIRDR